MRIDVSKNETAIKVLARLTDIGQPWPVGAWVYLIGSKSWIQIAYYPNNPGRHYLELSELEANERGIFRTKN